MSELLRKYWIPLALATFIGFLSIAPYLYAYVTLNTQAKDEVAIQYFFQDSELRYLSRMREITEGYWPAASPVFHEYKDAPNTQQPFGEALYALLALGQSLWLPSVLLFSKFAFPALLALLVYALVAALLRDVRSLSKLAKTTLAIFLAFVVTQGVGAHRLVPLLELISGGTADPVLSKWSRAVNPMFGGLLLFTTLLVVFRAQVVSFSIYRALGIGILVGLSSAYFFSIALLVCILFVLGGVFLCYREFGRFYELVVAAVVTTLINFPYVLAWLRPVETGMVSLEKNGLFHTHEPLLNIGIAIAACVFLLAYLAERRRQSTVAIFATPLWRFGVSVVLGSFIAYNLQVFLGVTVWPGHFAQYTDFLALIVIGLFGSVFVLAVGAKTQVVLTGVHDLVIVRAIPFVLGLLIALQLATVPSVGLWAEHYAKAQAYAPVWQQLTDSHPQGDCVVFALDQEIVEYDYITAYTPCDSYHSHFVFMGVPESRIMHNYVAYLRLQGVTADTLAPYLEEHQAEWQDLFYSDWRQKFANTKDRWLLRMGATAEVQQYLEETPREIEAAFMRSLDIDLVKYLQEFQIDYMVYDSKAMSSVVLEVAGRADRFGDIILLNIENDD